MNIRCFGGSVVKRSGKGEGLTHGRDPFCFSFLFWTGHY